MMLPPWTLIVSALISRLDAVFAVPMFEDIYAEDAKAGPPFAETFSATETRSTLSPNDNGTALGLPAWPLGRYTLVLLENFFLEVTAERYAHASPPLSRHLQNFVFEFSINIESEYPPPGISPLRATQVFYDTDSFTKVQIGELVIGLLASRAPTAILIKALATIAEQIRKHGPPKTLSGLIFQPRSGLIKIKAFNFITLDILQLESNGTDTSISDRKKDRLFRNMKRISQ